MTARMLMGIEDILITEKPDWVLVYGDTNSTLAGSIAASKLHIPIIHVEAGLRSFNNKMPEEINRIVSDRISSVHFCTSDLAVENLKKEGITKNVYNTGDVMYDAALFYSEDSHKNAYLLEKIGIEKRNFILVTCHRAENTNDPEKLENILSALHLISNDINVVFPLHPRTRNLIDKYNLSHYLLSLKIVPPLSYINMIFLEKNAKAIVTDSGGVQKEAYFFKTPCITIREETEWLETLEGGANILVGTNKQKIIDCIKRTQPISWPFENLYGDGKAGKKIVECISALS
jgi:UDP-GlcNAc3NAcA epimerase